MIPTLSLLLAETTDPDQQRSLIDDAGPIAGLFVLLLGIAIFFLWKSMSKQMKKKLQLSRLAMQQHGEVQEQWSFLKWKETKKKPAPNSNKKK